jgi:hypothetical protein
VAEKAGGGTSINLQFNYQRSKPRAFNHHSLNPCAGRSGKIEDQPQGVFRAGSKPYAKPREIRE